MNKISAIEKAWHELEACRRLAKDSNGIEHYNYALAAFNFVLDNYADFIAAGKQISAAYYEDHIIGHLYIDNRFYK